MAREGIWATMLEEQAAAIGAASPRVVRELLDTFGRWAEDALDRASDR